MDAPLVKTSSKLIKWVTLRLLCLRTKDYAGSIDEVLWFVTCGREKTKSLDHDKITKTFKITFTGAQFDTVNRLKRQCPC